MYVFYFISFSKTPPPPQTTSTTKPAEIACKPAGAPRTTALSPPLTLPPSQDKTWRNRLQTCRGATHHPDTVLSLCPSSCLPLSPSPSLPLAHPPLGLPELETQPTPAPPDPCVSLRNTRTLIADKVFSKSFCKSQFPHKFVN